MEMTRSATLRESGRGAAAFGGESFLGPHRGILTTRGSHEGRSGQPGALVAGVVAAVLVAAIRIWAAMSRPEGTPVLRSLGIGA